MKKIYESDLSDQEWSIISPMIPPSRPGGRPRRVNVRHTLNAIFYLLKTGCQWRMLPKDFPPWGTVHYYFRRWRLEGVWFKIHEELRSTVRKNSQKHEHSTIGIMDSQSVKTTEKRGYTDMMVVKR
ncbi:IS5 family transposase [Candidatus Odyssella acanthamoebae]|uniref:Transposase n=1 Tax=Candidatus Odyssella acanthamoebae TaxID=91604 RepID=A0A077AV96_9PROT|nr:IS5 family transposase [Candidatus Paracaedibacter acanthamoebae]AIK96326.1 transposase [Candidatus Paracaedibacter acanthamoebae]